jgi:2'-5' RNA ligase
VTRTFIAVEVSEAVRRNAVALAAALPSAGTKISWVSQENLHLTLQFLGEIPDAQIPDVSAVVDQVVTAHQPFPVRVRGLGAFPSCSRPGTLWLGITDGAPQLSRLAASLASALVPLGFRKERRRFHPHLTLGRVRVARGRAARDLSDALRESAGADAGTSTVDSLTVFASHLGSGGARYEALHHALLPQAETPPKGSSQ